MKRCPSLWPSTHVALRSSLAVCTTLRSNARPETPITIRVRAAARRVAPRCNLYERGAMGGGGARAGWAHGAGGALADTTPVHRRGANSFCAHSGSEGLRITTCAHARAGLSVLGRIGVMVASAVDGRANAPVPAALAVGEQAGAVGSVTMPPGAAALLWRWHQWWPAWPQLLAGASDSWCQQCDSTVPVPGFSFLIGRPGLIGRLSSQLLRIGRDAQKHEGAP